MVWLKNNCLKVISLIILLIILVMELFFWTSFRTKENTENITKLYKTVTDNNDCITLKNLAITGKDLIPLGIKGEKVGIILNKCLDMVLRDQTKNKKNILMEEVIKCML